MDFRHSRKGSQIVEFALILPVFMLLVLGGLDLSWYLLERHKVQDITSAACKAGAMSGVDPDADPYLLAGSYIQNLLDCSGAGCQIHVDVSPLSSDSVEWMECSVVKAHEPLTGYVPGMPDTLFHTSSWPIDNYVVDADTGMH